MSHNFEPKLVDRTQNPEYLVSRARLIYDKTPSATPILKSEMALALARNGIVGQADYIGANALAILARPNVYTADHLWMAERADEAVVGYSDLQLDQGDYSLSFLNTFASLNNGRETAARTDAALVIASSLLDVTEPHIQGHILEERIPTYLRTAKTARSKELALKQVAGMGIDLHGYLNQVGIDSIGFDCQNERRIRDDVNVLCARAYLANGLWLQANNCIQIIIDKASKAAVQSELWVSLNEAPDDEFNNADFRRKLAIEVVGVKEIMVRKADARGELVCALSQAAIFRSRNQPVEARSMLDSTEDRDITLTKYFAAARLSLYSLSGHSVDRDKAIQSTLTFENEPAHLLSALSLIVDTDNDHNRTEPAGPKETWVHHDGYVDDVASDSRGIPFATMEARILIAASAISATAKPDVLGEVYAHSLAALARRPHSEQDLNTLLAMTTSAAATRPAMVKALLARAFASGV